MAVQKQKKTEQKEVARIRVVKREITQAQTQQMEAITIALVQKRKI